MRTNCKLKIAYCYGPQMWITDQTVDWHGSNLTIRTPLLTGGGGAWRRLAAFTAYISAVLRTTMKLPPPSSSAWPARSWMSKVQIRQRGGQNPRLTSAETATVRPGHHVYHTLINVTNPVMVIYIGLTTVWTSTTKRIQMWIPIQA